MAPRRAPLRAALLLIVVLLGAAVGGAGAKKYENCRCRCCKEVDCPNMNTDPPTNKKEKTPFPVPHIDDHFHAETLVDCNKEACWTRFPDKCPNYYEDGWTVYEYVQSSSARAFVATGLAVLALRQLT